MQKHKEQLREGAPKVDRRVQDFVAEFLDLTRNAANEAELRSHFMTAAISKLGIRDLKNERERQDLRRNRVIIEFKDKGLFNASVTSAKFREAYDQLVKTYIPNQAQADNRDIQDYIGVCFDGLHMAFVFFEANGKPRFTDLRPFNELSAAALVLALDRDNRIELTPENFIEDFGPNSAVVRNVVVALWNHLNASLAANVNRVEMLYKEWNDLFQQSTGLGTLARAGLAAYLRQMGLPAGADPTRVLFVLHTYHALVFKLLAAELALVNRLIPGAPGDYLFGAAALPDDDLVKTLARDIEESELFKQVNILNFVEGSFFSWYVVNPPTDLVAAIRTMMQRLTLYRLSGLQLSRTRDIVKRVYQEIVPATLRHNIGEYFTPEWLVEFTLNRAGYYGPELLNRKYLDPTCGSGNFIIHAINRYKEQARAAGWDNEAILKGILDHIYGFDLNPLAVLTARVNYLIAIADLIGTASEVEIPIYQADAVYAPTITVAGPGAGVTRKYEIGTRITTIKLELPEELIQKNRLFARGLEIMERTIVQQDSVNVFVAALNNEPAYVAEVNRTHWEPFLRDMFSKIEFLESKGWNRIWCRIVRNYFASVAVGKCDVIAGNPPWVRWSELPEAYRDRIKPTCDSYGVFSEDRFFGGNELDISAMITYTVADKWLVSGGKLAFVITQTHFQSQSSGGFRRFNINGTPLEVEIVDDFQQVRPWPDLGNKPAVLTLIKGQQTIYPVPYLKWERINHGYISEDTEWTDVQQKLTCTVMEANPLRGPGEKWTILPPGRFAALAALDGEDPNIEGHKGIVTDLNGAYFIRLIGPGRLPNTVRFSNSPGEGRKPVPARTDEIELDLVFPLIKGARNIQPFYTTTSDLHVIVPNRRITPSAIPLVSQFPTGALRYFRAMNANKLMEQRSTWKTRMKPIYDEMVARGRLAPNEVPFYAIYDVGPYTFAPYKVVWAEISGSFQAAVISTANAPFGGGDKPVVPDHKVYFASFGDPNYAHYVCAMLNSEVVRQFIESFSIPLQRGTLFRHLRLPTFDPTNKDHMTLARLSQQAHQVLLNTAGQANISGLRNAMDTVAARILGIN